jgi:hypothetical protein
LISVKSAPGALSPSAIRSASKTSVVRMLLASCQPTTIRENTSMMKLKYKTPSQQRRYVKSPTHSLFGATAVKSRCTRSRGRAAAGSGVVVRHGRPRRFAPWISWTRISRSTRDRPTCSPARNSAFHMRLEPYASKFFLCNSRIRSSSRSSSTRRAERRPLARS